MHYSQHICVHSIDTPVGVPYVTNLEMSDTITPFSLTCTSTKFPPTEITWTKDGVIMDTTDRTKYTQQQVLMDRTTATYKNILEMSGDGEDMIGTYFCLLDPGISEIDPVEFNGKFLYMCTFNILQPVAMNVFLPSLAAINITGHEKSCHCGSQW